MEPIENDQIRILDLLPGEAGDPIRCRIRVANLQDQPQYEALSSVWVDQLCINQDGYQEKSAQVRLMRRIYPECKLAVLWLGDIRDDTMLTDATSVVSYFGFLAATSASESSTGTGPGDLGLDKFPTVETPTSNERFRAALQAIISSKSFAIGTRRIHATRCDYGLTVQQVYVAATMDFIEDTDGLCVLDMDPRVEDSIATPGLPRWALDLSATTGYDSTSTWVVKRYYHYFANRGLALDVWSSYEGLIGLGHLEVQPGDEVWIFNMGQVPFTLRKRNEARGSLLEYEFVGGAYVQGVMHGEWYEEQTPKPVEQTVYLY
ncbi:heterokaryon incompatibility protein [Seiridium cupressi]